MSMFNTYEIEEIILGMANIVQENRLLRKRVEELEDDVCQHRENSLKLYKESQKETADLLKALINPLMNK